jgi:hypothetical protein
MFLAVAEEVQATDYDETLLPIAVGLLVVALLYAVVAAWVVTQKARH